MELRQIIGNTWCLYGHQLIPLYRTDSTHCILLDTGASVLRQDIVDTLEQNGLTPIGLLCTHTHFDHFGNARYLSSATTARWLSRWARRRSAARWPP